MATVLITGGTGLIGKALTKALLNRGFHVIILSRQFRNRQRETGNLSYAQWNIENQTIDLDAMTAADHIIHLAGAGVADRRWTPARKQEIIQSRVKGGELITKALKENESHVRTVISSSGI